VRVLPIGPTWRLLPAGSALSKIRTVVLRWDDRPMIFGVVLGAPTLRLRGDYWHR